jgi:sulfur-carrier protein
MSDARKANPEIEISLRLHAQLREIADEPLVVIRLPSGSTVADAFECVIETHPGLAPFREVVAFARNDLLVTRTATFESGDRLDVLPPVSGG